MSVAWGKVQNFGDLGAFHPAFKTTAITGGTNNKVSAKRLLTLQNGGTVNETLTKHSNKQMMYGYKITGCVLPVSSYSAVIKVKVVGKDDKSGTDNITADFKGGLDNLKKITEATEPAADVMPLAK